MRLCQRVKRVRPNHLHRSQPQERVEHRKLHLRGRQQRVKRVATGLVRLRRGSRPKGVDLLLEEVSRNNKQDLTARLKRLLGELRHLPQKMGVPLTNRPPGHPQNEEVRVLLLTTRDTRLTGLRKGRLPLYHPRQIKH